MEKIEYFLVILKRYKYIGRLKFQWESKPISVMKLNLEDFTFVLWLCKLPIHGKIER